MEIWKPVAGFETYEVSSLGNVRRKLKSRVLAKTQYKIGGYYYVWLGSYKSKRRVEKVSILVAETFIGPRPKGAVCDHRDRNRLNNVATNIRWLSRSANYRNSDYAVASSNVACAVATPRLSAIWRPHISINRKRISLGSFYSKQTAEWVADLFKRHVTAADLSPS